MLNSSVLIFFMGMINRVSLFDLLTRDGLLDNEPDT